MKNSGGAEAKRERRQEERRMPDVLRALLLGGTGRQHREFDRSRDTLGRFRKEVANRDKLGPKEDS